MKKIVLAASTLALLAGAASASSPHSGIARVEANAATASVPTKLVPAGLVNSARDLSEMGVSANTPISVTFYTTNADIDRTGHQ